MYNDCLLNYTGWIFTLILIVGHYKPDLLLLCKENLIILQPDQGLV